MPTSPPTIAALPTAPDPSDRASFNPRAYSWSMALPTFGSQIGAVATNVFNNATEAAAAAASATASAQSAVLSPGTNATSTTSLTISAGSKTLTIQTGKLFAVGQFVLIASAASPQNFMLAQITSHDSNTGALAVSVSSTEGSGTFASWVISLSTPGAFLPKLGGTISGALGVGGATPLAPLHVYNAANFGAPDTTGTGVTGVGARVQNGTVNLDFGAYPSGNLWIQGRLNTDNATTFQLVLNPVGGPVLVGPGGLGYATGIGAGGTVTQVASKSTSVTLNKPSGRITMHSEPLAAGASVMFQLVNGTVGMYDTANASVVWGLSNPSFYRVEMFSYGLSPGTLLVKLTNIYTATLAEEVHINFAVVKGAAS